MNKELRSIVCINVKNYVSQRQKDVRFLALSTDKPRDDRDLVRQHCNGPLPPGFPRLTPVRCERVDCNCPLDIIYLSEDNIWDYIYSHDWSTSSSLRICEGHLLRRILETFKDLAEEGYIIMHKSARFDTCCFPKNPTSVKFLNLYEKDMIPEDVKIAFCSFAINPKQSSKFPIKSNKIKTKPLNHSLPKTENEERLESLTNGKENQDGLKSKNTTDSVTSVGLKSLPTDFKLGDSLGATSQMETQNQRGKQLLDNSYNQDVPTENSFGYVTEQNKISEPANKSRENINETSQKFPLNKSSTSDYQLQENLGNVPQGKTDESTDDKTAIMDTHTDEPTDGIQSESKEMSNTVKQTEANKNSPKPTPPSESFPKDAENLMFDGNAQVTCSRHSIEGSHMDGDSKVTRSETTMASRLKPIRRTHRKSTMAGRNSKRMSLEYDHLGRPKFKPSYEMVVDVADFKFNRCSSNSDEDSDCDRDHGTLKPVITKAKKIIRKKCKKPDKVRDSKLLNTIDPEEHYGDSDSEDELEWLNGVPPTPVRADVKSLSNYFRIRRKLKYGENEKKIVFRKDSDYFPGRRLHSRASFDPTSLGSTQGMSYFNSRLVTDSVGMPYSFSDLSLPDAPPSSIPSTTEADIKKASHEAVCGSHGKLCFINAYTSDQGEEESVALSSIDDEYGRGTMRFMNIALLNRIKTTYSNDRLSDLHFKKTGEEHVTQRRYAREAPKRRADKIIQKATAIFNDYARKTILDGLYKTKIEQARAQLPSIERVLPTPNDKKMRGKPDPNRPIDAMYKTVKPGITVPVERYHIELSPSQDPHDMPLPRYFQQEKHQDFRPYLLQAVQEFVIVKETVTRPAGRGTIVSLTVTKPRRYKFGSAKVICEENGLSYYDHIPNPPYPTPKDSREPFSTLDAESHTSTSTGRFTTQPERALNVSHNQLAPMSRNCSPEMPPSAASCPVESSVLISEY